MARALRRIARGASAPPGAVVLAYHRVAAPGHDPQRLAVGPDRFADHLSVVAAHARPMPLGELVRRLDERHDRPAVAVTIDDGYADALHEAAPRLARAGVPATVFVTTGAIAAGRGFWWDELDALLLGPGRLPERLPLVIDGRHLAWDLGADAGRDELEAARDAGWTIDARGNPSRRHLAYRDLCRVLRGATAGRQDEVLDQLAAITGRPRAARADRRPLTPGEVETLSRAPGITIGSHTVSHPSLAALAPDDQRAEIGGAIAWLREIIGRTPTTMAYPFGGVHDVSDTTAAIAREAGVTMACTTARASRRGDDWLRVPRIVVGDWTRDEFLERWAHWTAA